MHGAALVFDRLRRERRRALGRKPIPSTGWVKVRRRFLTFQFLAFAWVFFRADSVGAAFDVLARLGSFGPAPAVTPLLIIVLVAVFALQYFPEGWSARAHAGFRRVGPVAQTLSLGALLLVIDVLGPEGVPAFIYTGF
jgi:hypothetical protein